MQTQHKHKIEENPIARKTEKVETLLRDISDDARHLAERYPQESIVPEGGE